MQSLSDRHLSGFAGTAVLLTLLLVVFLSYVVKGFAGLTLLAPWLLPAAVFYWVVFRPSVCGNLAIFLLGLLEDGLAGTPFGLHAIALLCLAHLAYYQRRYLEHNPFPVIWTAYIINSLAVYVVMVLLMWAAGVPITAWIAGSWGVGVAFFPAIYALMGKLHFALTEDD